MAEPASTIAVGPVGTAGSVGTVETQYIDLIGLRESDVLPYVAKEPRHIDDPWTSILDFMIEARGQVEEIYRLDLEGAWKDEKNPEAKRLACTRVAAGAQLLRDLAYTAWVESERPIPPISATDLPNRPENPRYNPATGSAPAPAGKR